MGDSTTMCHSIDTMHQVSTSCALLGAMSKSNQLTAHSYEHHRALARPPQAHARVVACDEQRVRAMLLVARRFDLARLATFLDVYRR